MDAGDHAAPQTALATGGGSAHVNGGAQNDLSQVLEALQAIYAPNSSNDTRRQATEYLEQAKRHPDAPAQGFTLANDPQQPAALRHYGLTMLEYSIKYGWEDFTAEQGAELRGYVTQLATGTAESDPVYLRNKVAQLWTEIAKRSWGAEWLDMDEQLLSLWQHSLHHQAIVIYVLETLSEEVFNREDATAGLRGSDLGRCCVEIFAPAATLAEHLPGRDKGLDVRCGEEGWLRRLCDNLGWCLNQDYQNQESVRALAVKSLNALRAAMPWIIPKAIVAAQVVPTLCRVLAVPVIELQLVSSNLSVARDSANTFIGRHRGLSSHLQPPPPARRRFRRACVAHVCPRQRDIASRGVQLDDSRSERQRPGRPKIHPMQEDV
jgi:exportin-5